ncbi:hypothetical protein BpHYR1_002043 [Brachionus plicatilis]|uniref:Uncharacterized protein n=1 Tax=Brachionus plicatilis TaxID=10195 RepID=A0A3M7T0T9_BRAPC|nr:hypothetical protein BpHYR1_002043 [Brachionus plicatilis]
MSQTNETYFDSQNDKSNDNLFEIKFEEIAMTEDDLKVTLITSKRNIDAINKVLEFNKQTALGGRQIKSYT